MKELYKKHRPKTLEMIVGNTAAVGTLRGFGKNLPHAILFSGPSGTGKTTLARIIKRTLNCDNGDFTELNIADFRGIDDVRNVRKRINTYPLGGDCRIWLLDEVHSMTKDAQNALLKMLEDTPDHAYFVLATTEPKKLLPTIRTRCTDVTTQLLDPKEMDTLLQRVAKAEKMKVNEEVRDRITDIAGGSARHGLVLLNKLLGIKPKNHMKLIDNSDTKKQAIEIARALIRKSTTWGEMCGILKAVDDEPEGVRRLVLAYTTTVMLSGRPPGRAALVLEAFADNFFDNGKAGLVLACHDVIAQK